MQTATGAPTKAERFVAGDRVWLDHDGFTLCPGESARLTLSLHASAQVVDGTYTGRVSILAREGASPAPLEVAVVLDATGSYSADMRRITSDLSTALDQLSSTGTVVRVAVALAGDVPVFPFGTVTDRVYTLVTPPTSQWHDVLARVEAVEGGGDEREGILGALYALAGVTGTPAADTSTAPVSFSSYARRVVVVVTDNPPHESTDRWCSDRGCIAYPGPPTEDVRDALSTNS